MRNLFWLHVIGERISSNKKSFENIINLFNEIEDVNVIFPMGYKTQEILRKSNVNLSNNVKIIDPIGYLEFMYLLKNQNTLLPIQEQLWRKLAS